jgi:peptidoglycan/LPS O-acetylase OafA/YrhL
LGRAWLGRVHPTFYALAIGVMLLRPQLLGYFIVAALPLAVVLLAYTLPQIPRPFPDISYGIYVYHLPFLHAWVQFLPGVSTTEVVLMTFVSAISIAAASWYAIEARALRLKDWYPPKLSDVRRWASPSSPKVLLRAHPRIELVTPAHTAFLAGVVALAAVLLGRVVR